MDDQDNFTVALASNECNDFCAFNTNFAFGNVFEKPKNLTNYEVALVSLTYYDRYIKRDPDPVIPVVIKELPFFNIDGGDNKFRVETRKTNQLDIKKTDPVFTNFLNWLTIACRRTGIPVSFQPYFQNGTITKIKLRLENTDGAKLFLSEQLANILGFSDSPNISEGEHISTAKPDIDYYNKLKLEDVIGSASLLKVETIELALQQQTGTPNLSVLVADIITALEKANVRRVTFLVKKTTSSLVWKNIWGYRIQFSPFFNRYLGLEDHFIFHGNGTIQIPEEIIKPAKPDDPLPPEPPKRSTSCVIVTCDIVKESLVFGKQKNAIAVFNRKESDSVQQMTFAPANLTYKEIYKPFVSQIRISLQSDNNSYLEFCEEPTTCVLQFRRKIFD